MKPPSTKARKATTPGIFVAGVTACVSGVSIFLNSYGVKSAPSPTQYTTAKNLVAAITLGIVWSIGYRLQGHRASSLTGNFSRRPHNVTMNPITGWQRVQWSLALAYVGVIGGGLAFVLFFDGLARSQPASSSFWRDTLLVWVVLGAAMVLRERLRWWNIAAVILLVIGEVVVSGGVGHLGSKPGELDVLASSVLWAVEIIVAKRLLSDFAPATVSTFRMSVGAIALVAYLALTHRLSSLVSLNAHELFWVVATGLVLAAYVATWMTALSRARAIDVTSLLTGSALITWLLQVLAGTTAIVPSSLGLALITGGALLVLGAAARPLIHRRGPVKITL